MLDPASERSGTPPRAIHPSDRVAAAAEIVLCSGVPTQLILTVALISAGMQMTGDDERLLPPFVFLLSLLDAIVVVGLVCLLLRARGEAPRRVLLGNRPPLREALLGVLVLPLIFVGILALLALILTVAPWLHNIERNPLVDMLRTPRDAIVFGLVVMIAGGVREEVQRGFILHRFERFLGGGTTGVVVYSALFGLGHIDQGYHAVIATALLGACWGVLYLARRSIVAPIVSHAGFNLAQLVKFWVVVG